MQVAHCWAYSASRMGSASTMPVFCCSDPDGKSSRCGHRVQAVPQASNVQFARQRLLKWFRARVRGALELQVLGALA